jgi:hypothetical protein
VRTRCSGWLQTWAHGVYSLHLVHVLATLRAMQLWLLSAHAAPQRLSSTSDSVDLLQGEFVPKKTGRPVLLVAAGIGEHRQSADA